MKLLTPVINGRMLTKIPLRHEYSHGPLATAISASRFDTQPGRGTMIGASTMTLPTVTDRSYATPARTKYSEIGLAAENVMAVGYQEPQSHKMPSPITHDKQ